MGCRGAAAAAVRAPPAAQARGAAPRAGRGRAAALARGRRRPVRLAPRAKAGKGKGEAVGGGNGDGETTGEGEAAAAGENERPEAVASGESSALEAPAEAAAAPAAAAAAEAKQQAVGEEGDPVASEKSGSLGPPAAAEAAAAPAAAAAAEAKQQAAGEEGGPVNGEKSGALVPPAAAEATAAPVAAAAAMAKPPAAGADGAPVAAAQRRLALLFAPLLRFVRAILPMRLLRLAVFGRVARLRTLRQAADAAPGDAARQAAYLAALAKGGKHDAIVKRFEATPEAAMNASGVAEYLRALVVTNRLKSFTDASGVLEKTVASGAVAGSGAGAKDSKMARVDAAAAALAASDKRTLSQLLEDLGARAGGSADKSADAGATPARPLHVVMSAAGGAALGARPRATGPVGMLRDVFSTLLFMLALAVAWLFGTAALKRYVSGSPSGMGQGAGAGQSAASSSYAPKEYNKDAIPETSRKTFDDVLGCEEAKEELVEVVQYLKNPERFSRLGGTMPKGVLLTGPPGTGKTLLARAVAGEAGVPFFYRAGSEFEEMFVGVGSRRVRQLFAAAKKKAPCIIFIDEIDAIGGNRKAFESHTRKTLNQLLVEMDGFEASEGVIVMSATNIPESLDPALTRPGRFDRHVVVPNPDIKGRRQILEHYLKGKPVAADVEVEQLARGTPGFSGADLYNLVNMAAIKAAVEDAKEVSLGMLEFAKDKILMGAERKSMSLTEEGRRLTAFHEAGHALVALRTEGAMPIHKATIMPRGTSLGMTMQLPEHKDETSQSKQQMLAELDICMGGRIAEELVFGKDAVTSGARGDLEQATAIAKRMVTEYGMSDAVGPMYINAGRKMSADTERMVDKEVRQLLTNAYARATALITEHLGDLHKLADELLEKETLDAQEIRRAIGLPATPVAPSSGEGSEPTAPTKDIVPEDDGASGTADAEQEGSVEAAVV